MSVCELEVSLGSLSPVKVVLHVLIVSALRALEIEEDVERVGFHRLGRPPLVESGWRSRKEEEGLSSSGFALSTPNRCPPQAIGKQVLAANQCTS